jgi:hypothetical protein
MRCLILIVAACLAIVGCRTNEAPDAQVTDMRIAADVKAKLASEVGLSTVTNVSVNATNGVVTLSGQVDSDDARSKVNAVAKAAPNVVRVVDALQVVPKKQSRIEIINAASASQDQHAVAIGVEAIALLHGMAISG